MPIRTNRGRAAVYRRLWGWPMRSPTHLVGTVILVVAIIVSVGLVLPRLLEGNGGANAGSPTSDAENAAQAGDTERSRTLDRETLPTRLSEPLETPSSAAPAPEALRVAQRWVTAWATAPEDDSTDAWIDGLRPYTTAEFLPRLRTVEPGNITATEVVGSPEARESHPKSVRAEVDTDGPTLLVTVIDTGDGWRVTDYAEVTG